jgi:hypothetical protein
MDKSVVVIFVFSTIVLVSLMIILLILSSGSAGRRAAIRPSGKQVRSKYRTTRGGLGRRIYPPPLGRDRRL